MIVLAAMAEARENNLIDIRPVASLPQGGVLFQKNNQLVSPWEMYATRHIHHAYNSSILNLIYWTQSNNMLLMLHGLHYETGMRHNEINTSAKAAVSFRIYPIKQATYLVSRLVP